MLKILKSDAAEDLYIRFQQSLPINSDFKKKLVTDKKILDEVALSQILIDADQICDHVFDLLGSGKTALGPEINWHRDFKNDFCWSDREYYLWTGNQESCYLRKGICADVKIPWELSRFQHLVTLGKAYWFSGDEKYAAEYVNQIDDWINKNPVELGINWACTMDVAIRAVNWIWASMYFSNSKFFTQEFKLKLVKSLFLHGRHIFRNLEYGYPRGNHFLADISGLTILGLFFQSTAEGKRWLDFGTRTLIEEMTLQVSRDGVYFEGSISYHRLATELFLVPTVLCSRNNRQFPQQYLDRLERMIEFIASYTKPDGTAPQVGDNDDGRLLILSDYSTWERRDHRYLISLGAQFFQRYDFFEASNGWHEDNLWLFGCEPQKTWKDHDEKTRAFSSHWYKEGGFGILRNQSHAMIIDLLKNQSYGSTGHRHNSRLSFELCCGKTSFIVDPGSYVYTSDKDSRNVFRSSKYHNVVVIDNQEQNSFDPNMLFKLGEQADVTINKWISTDQYDFLTAEHNGYSRLPDPVIHKRQYFFDKKNGFFIIRDLLTGASNHVFELFFHIEHNPVIFNKIHPLSLICRGNEGDNLLILPRGPENLSGDLQDGWISHKYGERIHSKILRYAQTSVAPVTFITLFIPFHSESEINQIIDKAEQALNFMDLAGEQSP